MCYIGLTNLFCVDSLANFFKCFFVFQEGWDVNIFCLKFDSCSFFITFITFLFITFIKLCITFFIIAFYYLYYDLTRVEPIRVALFDAQSLILNAF